MRNVVPGIVEVCQHALRGKLKKSLVEWQVREERSSECRRRTTGVYVPPVRAAPHGQARDRPSRIVTSRLMRPSADRKRWQLRQTAHSVPPR